MRKGTAGDAAHQRGKRREREPVLASHEIPQLMHVSSTQGVNK